VSHGCHAKNLQTNFKGNIDDEKFREFLTLRCLLQQDQRAG
jgi:hypothetical protein